MDTTVGIDFDHVTAMFTVNVRTTAAAIAIQTTLVPSDRVSLCGSLAGSHLEFHHGCYCIVIGIGIELSIGIVLLLGRPRY
jgi:hypothetical protein